MTEVSFTLYKSIDLTGSSCAGVIGELSGVYEELRQGEYVEVLIGADSDKKDLYAWASRVGAKIMKDEKVDKGFRLEVARPK
ncbi:MAG: response regulator SirA [Nitrososphaerota archaeon]|jgi:TusA-related sulfurtransferase|nr:response regulator SirA [Nitrososphaerota archaeon]